MVCDMSERGVMVELEGVSKGFGTGSTRVEVLKDLRFAVDEGSMLAIVGPSGVGKSTLLHLIGLLERPDSGGITIAGEAMDELDGEARAKVRNQTIGFVFQHHYLLDELDARDNVALPLRIAGNSASLARSRADELLDAVSMSHRSHHYPDQLSGGEQQRVAVARALAMKPRLLLADEPTGNLDRANSDQVFGLVRELHLLAGLTSLIVTHDEDMARMCDGVFRLAPAGVAIDHV
jgi:lipoprotein-releasing system ATP-binding protein